MTFRVGQKVVCVDDGRTDYRVWAGDVPKIGAVYTIVRIFDDIDPVTGDVVSLELAEIKNSRTWQYGYAARRFRPVVERKTSIEIFTKMLNPQGVDA